MTPKKVLVGLVSVAVLGGIGVAAISGGVDDGKITLGNPQVVQWDKPTTDAEWAEDVKAENLELKNTEDLLSMIELHRLRLVDLLSSTDETLQCTACVSFRVAQENPDWSEEEIAAEVQSDVQDATFQVEKLQQSIERMENEFRLRKTGFVRVEGEENGVSFIDPPINRIRRPQ